MFGGEGYLICDYEIISELEHYACVIDLLGCNGLYWRSF